MPLYNADLKPLAAGVGTHDWQHAAKLFLADNLRLAPKQSFLYYVCVNINQDFLTGVMGTGVSSQGMSDQYETGMMVKSVNLPKFSIDTKTMNAYNKKTVVQNKINYDPITVTFHDDAANVVLNFWNDYYTYYYRDSDYEPTLYGVPSTYDLRQRTKWGYSPRNTALKPFLRDIQIFSLNQKRFTEYRLINPMITAWRHGDHNASEGTGTMECSMTLSYETVKYRTGYVNPVDVNGFSLLHYDNTPSPISTSTTNIYTDQGFLGALDGGSKDLARPDGAFGAGGLVSNYLSIQRAYDNLKSVNWGSVAQQTLSQIGVGVLNGAINGAFNGLFVPTTNSYYNSSASGITAQGLTNLAGFSAGNSILPSTSGYTNGLYPSGYQTGYVTSNGNLVDRASGAVVGKINQQVDSYFALQPTSGRITLGSDGQPQTGTTTSRVIDPNTGEVISQFEIGTTASGGYTPSNDVLNLTETRVITAADGSSVIHRTYMNGDVMIIDSNNNASVMYANTTPSVGGTTTPSALTQYGTGVSYAINPFSGQLSVLNGIANRVISTPINAVVNGVLTPINAAVDQAVKYATNSVITGIIDPLTGQIGQALDGLTGQIKNIFGFDDTGNNPYLVCSIDGTVQSTFSDSYGLTYATDFMGETVPVYQDLTLSQYTGGGQYYD